MATEYRSCAELAEELWARSGESLTVLLSAFLFYETVENTVLWGVAPGSVVETAGVSEEHAASITEAENLRKYDSNVLLVRFGKCLQDYTTTHHRIL
jgi:hypothetical protein